MHAPGITMLTITATVMGKTTAIHPSLLWEGSRVVLVDTGYPGQLPLLEEALLTAGHPVDTITDILLTHQDIDHIGGLPALNERLQPRPVSWASAAERPYIEGQRMLIKITHEAVDHAVASLPSEMPEERRAAFRHALLNPPKGPIDRVTGYGIADTPIAGIDILDTPGHTPGHISLYHRASKTLIAGDALVLNDGQLYLPDASMNSDHVQARRSLLQLADLPAEAIICYHGGYHQGDIQARIRELINGDQCSQTAMPNMA